MSNLAERLKLARRHVVKGRQIVERQQLVVRSGTVNIAEAIKLLALFETTQAIFEDDLDRLLREESTQLSGTVNTAPATYPAQNLSRLGASLALLLSARALLQHGREAFRESQSKHVAAHLGQRQLTNRFDRSHLPPASLAGGVRVAAAASARIAQAAG
ncbi:hypothetical protein [Bradyrhizobium sp. WSM2793]|uniref:hypothetical protein n=1 Tax=Bradyrhizobium sp. WSM2793 TaxID=1038866 RepID=UPI0003613776|nr:hypothetical protein [Bradyrhizobium sp. WSM2793]